MLPNYCSLSSSSSKISFGFKLVLNLIKNICGTNPSIYFIQISPFKRDFLENSSKQVASSQSYFSFFLSPFLLFLFFEKTASWVNEKENCRRETFYNLGIIFVINHNSKFEIFHLRTSKWSNGCQKKIK